MSDPKYNKYAGTVRFDDDNIVDIDLQPDTENIHVLLNGSEVTGGGSEPFIIDVSEIGTEPDASGYYTCVIDKTVEQIVAAFNANRMFMIRDSGITLFPAACTVTYNSENPTELISVSVNGLIDVSLSGATCAGIYIDVYQHLDPQYYYANLTLQQGN